MIDDGYFRMLEDAAKSLGFMLLSDRSDIPRTTSKLEIVDVLGIRRTVPAHSLIARARTAVRRNESLVDEQRAIEGMKSSTIKRALEEQARREERRKKAQAKDSQTQARKAKREAAEEQLRTILKKARDARIKDNEEVRADQENKRRRARYVLWWIHALREKRTKASPKSKRSRNVRLTASAPPPPPEERSHLLDKARAERLRRENNVANRTRRPFMDRIGGSWADIEDHEEDYSYDAIEEIKRWHL